MSNFIRSACCVLALIALCMIAPAQIVSGVTTTNLPYCAPAYQEVLAGKAPLRVLLVSRSRMLAFKSASAITISMVSQQKPLYTTRGREQIGLVQTIDGQSFFLRKDSKNFLPFSGILRLQSRQVIHLWTSSPDKWATYPAPILITPTKEGTLSVAREMYLEEYLRNVLPAEMPATFHPEALRAQAIIARTYTLVKLGRHADEGADICDLAHCQVFRAEAARNKASDMAVTDTRGIVIMYHGKLAEPYYHTCCGGVTDDGAYIWGPEYAFPYLTGVQDTKEQFAQNGLMSILERPDAYCRASGYLRWSRHFTINEVCVFVKKNLPVVTGDTSFALDHVTNMVVEERTPSGRAASLRVEGDGASVLVYGDQIRWLFGNGQPGAAGLWSTLFDLTLERNTLGDITGVTFTGAGRGHGLGLCQWGADGRARAGQHYRDILLAYYPGTQLLERK